MKNQYMFPLDCAKLKEAEKLPKISTAISVRNHILLLILTSPGQYDYNSSFGSSLWEYDFDVCVTQSSWTGEMQDALMQSIISHEKRINENFRVQVKVDNTYSESNPKDFKPNYSIHISDLVLTETNEAIPDIMHNIIFSPLNLE